jgi:hypothetical protein
VLQRAARGQHRVQHEHRQAGQVGGQGLQVGARGEGLLVPGEADEAHRRLRQQGQRRVRHAQPGPQDRYQQGRVGDPAALGLRDGRLHRVPLDRERAGGLVDQHRGQLVQRCPESA